MKAPPGPAVLWAVLAVLAFAAAGYALWTDDRRLAFLMIGLLVGPFLLSFAWMAHKRDSVVLYVLLRKARPAADLGDDYWQPGPYREVVGYTAMGTALLRNPADGRYAVLPAFYGGRAPREVGRYASLAEFEARYLRQPAARAVLLVELTTAVHRQYGPLGKDQVYIPIPYPVFAKTPQSYDRGDYWVFMDLVGQTLEQLGL